MTDAKGLSEVEAKEVARKVAEWFDEYCIKDGWIPLQALLQSHTALAERLKACEESVDKLRGRRLNLIEYLRELEQERDRLTADLDELKLRLKMEAECHEQTVADLEQQKTMRAEVERRRDVDLETFAQIRKELEADLERARAEVERLRRIKREAVGAFNEAAKENERLKAIGKEVLEAVIECPDKMSGGLMDRFEAALKETPGT